MTRVLYAEDDLDVAQMVQLFFVHFDKGDTIDLVHSGRACLEAMERGGYDVLLLDLMMPDLNGLQVLGELTARRDPTPVIMVSGQGQQELVVRALRAGAVDCIDKTSLDFRRIPEAVHRVHARAQRQLHATAVVAPVTYRVLFIDPEPQEQADVATFFATNAPRLRLTTSSTSALDSLASGEFAFDAVVLGPNLRPATMLDALRQLRACDEDMPVIVLSAADDAETTVAAFKLGADDYLLGGNGIHPELVFSLNNALKQADAERTNARLTSELAELNRSLASQVAARTRELQQEVVVRREAEQRAGENAARLEALSTRLLRVQEDERRALAQELHDQVGQLLTGLRFQLEAARNGGPNAPLDEALTLTSELLKSVRALTLQLRPRLLDDLGLRPALEWQTKLFHHQTGIEVDLEISLPPRRLAAELETAVFRLVQEALTNVARHSGANRASVTVTADDVALLVEVSDRGCGFDPRTALSEHDSLGLAGLTDRVRLAGGRLDIFSEPGQGTRLHAEFPIALTPANHA